MPKQFTSHSWVWVSRAVQYETFRAISNTRFIVPELWRFEPLFFVLLTERFDLIYNCSPTHALLLNQNVLTSYRNNYNPIDCLDFLIRWPSQLCICYVWTPCCFQQLKFWTSTSLKTIFHLLPPSSCNLMFDDYNERFEENIYFKWHKR